ncbi:olfactory receptor 6F1-like [Carettochelys insculpta]|uniref:olfactory receptor 6F1-like n=1 Tax=Carettochelys insculpta TaxID=44489 RepID=UPI003EBC2EE5
MNIACVDASKHTAMIFTLTTLFIMSSSLFIILSYICIISIIIRLSLSEGRHKGFSTSSCHITVVTLLYGTTIFTHLSPESIAIPESDQIIFLMYTVVTPVLNPIIYTLRNKEVNGAFRKTVEKDPNATIKQMPEVQIGEKCTPMDVKAETKIRNQTSVQEFILLGFPGTWYFRMSLAVLFSVTYILTVIGNICIISLVRTHPQLHTPMYFFLCNLSFLEIWLTTTSAPKAIGIMLGTSQTISFTACLMQMYFLISLGGTECFLLAAMAYDRYLAICHPLRYNVLMNNTITAQLALASWMGGFLAVALVATLISRLSFCDANIINHFICHMESWIVLSCTDTHVIELTAFILSIIVVIFSCTITLVSYVCIISTISRIPSGQAWQKAFSTCSAHLIVVTLWFGSCIILFVKPSAQNTEDLNKTVNIFNTIITPLLNPFIYTLRNKEVKEAFGKTVRGNFGGFRKFSGC